MVCCIAESDPGAAAVEMGIATLVNRLCWTLFGLLSLARLRKLKDITEANIATIEEYYGFDSSCTDQYSQINTDELMR